MTYPAQRLGLVRALLDRMMISPKAVSLHQVLCPFPSYPPYKRFVRISTKRKTMAGGSHTHVYAYSFALFLLFTHALSAGGRNVREYR